MSGRLRLSETDSSVDREVDALFNQLVATATPKRSGKHAAALAMATELALAHRRAGIPCRVRIVAETPEREAVLAKELMDACGEHKLLGKPTT